MNQTGFEVLCYVGGIIVEPVDNLGVSQLVENYLYKKKKNLDNLGMTCLKCV